MEFRIKLKKNEESGWKQKKKDFNFENLFEFCIKFLRKDLYQK